MNQNANSRMMRILLMAATLVIAVSTTSCADDDRLLIHASGAEYSSVEDLTVAADVVVIATASDTARHVSEGGVPVVYREFTVNEVLFDPSGFVKDDTIDVSLFDTDEVITDQQSEIVRGQRLLLFLGQVSAEEVATIKPLTQVFAPLSSDNAIFDVSDSGTITARSRAITGLWTGDTARSSSTVEVTPEGEEIPQERTSTFTDTLDAVREVTAEAKP